MDDEREPDPRMTLAAERTYLAYLRTGLALVASGVALAGALPDAGVIALRRAVGVILVLSGLGVFLLSRRRWNAVDQAMRRGEPLPRVLPAHVLAWVLAAIALMAAAIVLLV